MATPRRRTRAATAQISNAVPVHPASTPSADLNNDLDNDLNNNVNKNVSVSHTTPYDTTESTKFRLIAGAPLSAEEVDRRIAAARAHRKSHLQQELEQPQEHFEQLFKAPTNTKTSTAKRQSENHYDATKSSMNTANNNTNNKQDKEKKETPNHAWVMAGILVYTVIIGGVHLINTIAERDLENKHHTHIATDAGISMNLSTLCRTHNIGEWVSVPAFNGGALAMCAMAAKAYGAPHKETGKAKYWTVYATHLVSAIAIIVQVARTMGGEMQQNGNWVEVMAKRCIMPQIAFDATQFVFGSSINWSVAGSLRVLVELFVMTLIYVGKMAHPAEIEGASLVQAIVYVLIWNNAVEMLKSAGKMIGGKVGDFLGYTLYVTVTLVGIPMLGFVMFTDSLQQIVLIRSPLNIIQSMLVVSYLITNSFLAVVDSWISPRPSATWTL